MSCSRILPGVRCLVVAASLAAFPASAAERPASAAAQFLQARAQPPAEYVLSKLRDHRVVLLGENHWLRHDVRLVAELVPRLRGAGAEALALEVLPASQQAAVDRLVAAPAWDGLEIELQ